MGPCPPRRLGCGCCGARPALTWHPQPPFPGGWRPGQGGGSLGTSSPGWPALGSPGVPTLLCEEGLRGCPAAVGRPSRSCWLW